MPIILRCQCGKETPHVYPANEGWTIEPQIGGTEVLCPDCRQKKAAASLNHDNLTPLLNLFGQRPIDFVKYGRMLFFLFREEQKKHGHNGCLCAECESNMINALKKIATQEALSTSKKPAVETITRPITPVSTLRPAGAPPEEPNGNEAA